MIEQVERDVRVERVIGRLLQGGVLASAAIVIIGALVLLVREGRAPTDYRVFHAEPAALRSLAGIVAGALGGDSRAIVQLGLVVLIATPVARVALTLIAFIVKRDRLYTIISAAVLLILTYSLWI